MTVRHSARYWSFAFSLFMVACASTPRLFEFRFSREVLTSRDGRLQYRLPEGWINATTDSPSADNLIWLVRSDYAAMLVVREVMVDGITRKQISSTGLSRLGELLVSLESSEQGASMVKQPTPSTIDGLSACTYEYIAGNPGDRVHVVLVDTGKKVYEVSTRITETKSREMLGETISLQEAFLLTVVW